jgi:hypothetical protein
MQSVVQKNVPMIVILLLKNGQHLAIIKNACNDAVRWPVMHMVVLVTNLATWVIAVTIIVEPVNNVTTALKNVEIVVATPIATGIGESRTAIVLRIAH